MQQTTDTLPISEHFQLEQLAEGVYAAIAIQGGAAQSNAGIIDLGVSNLFLPRLMSGHVGCPFL